MVNNNYFMTEDRAEDYIKNQRISSLLNALGYSILVLAAIPYRMMGRGGKLPLIFLVLAVLTGLVLVLLGYLVERREDAGIKESTFSFEAGYYRNLEDRFKTMRIFSYIIMGMAFLIIGYIIVNTLIILIRYKACPNYDNSIIAFGAAAIFAYAYSSGVMEAYKILVKNGTSL